MTNTLKDIAKETGLSVSTISRVVTGKDLVAPKTRKKVLDALSKYNYVPNQIARSLKTQATNSVGIIVPDIGDYFAKVIKGADKVFSQSHYSIILADSDENPEKEEQYIKLMYEKRVDGLILATVSKSHEALSLYTNNTIPVVFIDNLPNLKTSFDCVLLDNAKASGMVVDHLAAGGHKRIAVINGLENETTGYERAEGYRQAVRNRGLEADNQIIKYGDFKEQSGYQCMMELLDNRDAAGFSAVYVTSYKMTCGALKALKERNVKLPDALAFVGFDFSDKTGLIVPEITTILQPISSIGRLVANLLITKMHDIAQQGKRDESQPVQRIMLEPILKVRESCGCKKE